MDYVQERDNRDPVAEAELLQMFNEAAAELTEADRAEFERLVVAFAKRDAKAGGSTASDPEDR